MSGLITGPDFKQFFNEPDAFQLGTMVAVLEVGAFGEVRCTMSSAHPNIRFSNFHSCWSRRRLNWSAIDPVLGCSAIHDRRCRANVHYRIFDDAIGSNNQRIRCWASVVS